MGRIASRARQRFVVLSVLALAGAGMCSLAAPAGAAQLRYRDFTVISQPPGPMPAQYQPAYSVLQSQVGAFAAAATSGPRRHSSTTFGSELLAANGNIGTGLLAPTAITAVETELDAFRALGATGVTVDVAFPLLLRSTPNSSRYLTFYEQVARQVHERHMVLSVEENPVFVGTTLTTLPISFAGLTIQSYAAEQRQQAQLIIDELHPKYLTLLAEPDTYSANLHLDLDSPETAVQVVRTELAGLRRHGTRVGAGSGTWLAPGIDQALVGQTSINYLDAHVYTIGPDSLANLADDIAAARAAHKPLVMDETWLDKPTGGPSGPQGAARQLQVKSFSFWEPLDEQYVSAMVNEVRSQGFKYVSFFDGARAFFGYLTWSPELDAASYQTVEAEYNRLVAANIQQHMISLAGLRFHDAIGNR